MEHAKPIIFRTCLRRVQVVQALGRADPDRLQDLLGCYLAFRVRRPARRVQAVEHVRLAICLALRLLASRLLAS